MIQNLSSFARVKLGHMPTPIDHAVKLGEDIGINLYIKRDDCTGLAFGGNKVRQLEFYMGAAKQAEADSLLITGAVQSNFVRTAAAAARVLGMQPHVQLEQRVASNDPLYQNSGNVLVNHLLGATVYSFDQGEDEAAADAELERIAAKLSAQGHTPYVIHLGIEHPPIGGLGYAAAAEEIQQQCIEMDTQFDHIVVASGSALTHSGLLCGLRALGLNTPVHGICVRRDEGQQASRVLRRSREIGAMLGYQDLIAQHDILVHDEVFAPGYGTLNDATWEAIQKAAQLEAMMLDPVYTGRTLAGCIALVKDGSIEAGSRVLMIHTGGQPAIFAYQNSLQVRLDQHDA